MKRIYSIALLMLVLFLSTPALATPGVEWNYFETEHFRVIYHNEVLDQAHQVAEIAESVFRDQAKFTGFTPFRKIAVIVSGLEDFANGYAIPRDIMKIWVNPLMLTTRVDQDWLKNLVTHELTHVLQMEATFGTNYWLQKATGSSTILGYPPNAYHPTWFLEGAAQYGSYRHGYDGIDRKREMVMEQRIQNDNFYTNAELIWLRGDINGEGMYNFGFGFFEYLMRTYGERKFLELQKTHNSLYLFGLQNSIRTIYGKRLSELVDEWKAELQKKYPVRVDREIAELITGDKPTISEWKELTVAPSGDLIFVEANVNRSTYQLKRWAPETGLTILLETPTLAMTRTALSPDGERLVYTTYQVVNGLVQYDLFELDLETGLSKRLTKDQRILQAVYYKDGYLVVKNEFGRTQLYFLKNGQLTRLTDYDYNFSIGDLAVSPDQTRVALNFNYNGKRGIALLSTADWKFEKVYYPNEGLDWILGEFSDNQHLTLSWDRLQHYDLYLMDIQSGEVERISNTREDVLYGAAFRNGSWYGQIYGPTGFTFAKGQIGSYEKLTVKPGSTKFTRAPKVTVDPLREGRYNHLRQLRSEMLVPYFDSSELIMGWTQVLMDPLMELQVVYDLGYNITTKRPHASFQTVWLGENPGLGALVEYDGQNILAQFQQSYDLYPYVIAAAQQFSYSPEKEPFSVDFLQLQAGRAWLTNLPGTTMAVGTYYPANSTRNGGFTLVTTHTQSIPVEYAGDALDSKTIVGITGGDVALAWGKNTSTMWVHPEEKDATMMVVQQLNYRHNLLDVSADLMNFLQTGRIYLNTFGEIGFFKLNDETTIANMVGVGLELETKVLNMIQMNHTLDVATNSDGDLRIKYGFTSPF